jgi:hypothetical protein
MVNVILLISVTCSGIIRSPSSFYLLRDNAIRCFGQIVYENEHVVAFLDKFPMVAGHTLVVPKKQVAKMHGEIPVSFSSPVLMVTSV